MGRGVVAFAFVLLRVTGGLSRPLLGDAGGTVDVADGGSAGCMRMYGDLVERSLVVVPGQRTRVATLWLGEEK